MYQIAISLALGTFTVLGIGAVVAQATSYSSCTNSYQEGTPAPQGYGAAYDTVFGGLDVAVNCNSNTVTVGNGNSGQYIYKTGYVYQNGWQALNLSSQSTLQSNNWYTGTATVNLGSVDLTQPIYVVGYTCDWNGAWKCGCADQACATSAWQLQAVKGTVAPTQTTTDSQASGNNPVEITLDNVQESATLNVSVGTTLHAAYDQSGPGHYYAMVYYQASDNTSVVSGGADSNGSGATMQAVGTGTAHLSFKYSAGCADNVMCPQATHTSTVTINVQ